MANVIVTLPDGRTYEVGHHLRGIAVRVLVSGDYGVVGNVVTLPPPVAIDAMRKGIVEPVE